MEIRADASLRRELEELVSGARGASSQGLTSAAADALLASIVWSHVVEPGDAVAGTLIAHLGAGPAIDLVASRTTGAQLCDALRGRGHDEVTPRQASAAIARWAPRLNRSVVMDGIARARARGISVVAPGTDHWPASLDDLGAHAPVLLWLRGDAALLCAPALAVVGARASTGYGAHVTAELTGDACGAGVAIVSGAAYGIDAVAHRAALALGTPTIAVLAGGADRSYPSGHRQLLEHIASVGAVCSEMAPGSAPTRWRFLQRNRVIAALARATLVTEAGPRSGSLNTAGHAAELGRALGAVPGPITSAASVGCHRLIREYGASLITDGRDLRELLGISEDASLGELLPGGSPPGQSSPEASTSEGAPPEGSRESAVHQRVVDALPLRGARTSHEVARRAGLAFDDTSAALAELELLGRVRRRDSPGDPEELWGLERGQ